MAKQPTETRENVVNWYGDSPAVVQVEVRPGIYNEHRHDSLKSALMQALVCRDLKWKLHLRVRSNHSTTFYTLTSDNPNTFTYHSKVDEHDPTPATLRGAYRGLFND